MSQATSLDEALVTLVETTIKEAGVARPLPLDHPVNWYSIAGLCELYKDKIPNGTVRRHLNNRYENGLHEMGATTRRGKRLLTNGILYAQWLRTDPKPEEFGG